MSHWYHRLLRLSWADGKTGPPRMPSTILPILSPSSITFLYSLDALLCLLVIPFTYFWYEEYDEVAVEAGEQTLGQRFWGALKYTISFVAIVVILFLVGFLVPVSNEKRDMDLDYFKHLLTENRAYSLPILLRFN